LGTPRQSAAPKRPQQGPRPSRVRGPTDGLERRGGRHARKFFTESWTARCRVDLAESSIITSAHRINQAPSPDLSPRGTESDFYFVQADDPETVVGRIIKLVKTRIPKQFGLDL
jgi:hypothetical protein